MAEALCTQLGCHARCHVPSSPRLVQPLQPIGEREEERDTKVEHEERERESLWSVGENYHMVGLLIRAPTETPILD
jgi:hypothetical protein